MVADPDPINAGTDGVMDHTPPFVASVNAGVFELTQTLKAPPAMAATDGGVLILTVTLPVIVFWQEVRVSVAKTV